MNELKPEDVKRALECCSSGDDCIGGKCPYHASCQFCITEISTDALALLREKDAEIERLNTLNKVLKDNNHQCHRLGYEDAIDEFAERLKEHFELSYILFLIDHTAKELKGEVS